MWTEIYILLQVPRSFYISDKSLIDKMVFVFNPNHAMVMINVDKVRKNEFVLPSVNKNFSTSRSGTLSVCALEKVFVIKVT